MPKKRSKKTTSTETESRGIGGVTMGIIVVALAVALAVAVPFISSASASGAAAGGGCAALQAPGADEAAARKSVARARRRVLNKGTGQRKLAKELEKLHATPRFAGVGALPAPVHAYGSPRVLNDQQSTTGAHRAGGLLHGDPVAVVDAPIGVLPVSGVAEALAPLAAYNPSLLRLAGYRGSARPHYLVTLRASSWHLCTWRADSSPLELLPRVRGKTEAKSHVLALVLDGEDFSVVTAMHDLGGLRPEDHECDHHTGMRRVGHDDGRLFELQGRPWLAFASVARADDADRKCEHRMELCPISFDAEGRATCDRMTTVHWARADQISHDEMQAGRPGNVHQKNWSPVVHAGELFLVFTVEPFVVLRVDPTTGEAEQVGSDAPAGTGDALRVRADSPQGGSSVHGGTHFVPLPPPSGGDDSDGGEEYLGIARVKGNSMIQYSAFFMTLRARPGTDGGGFAISRVGSLFYLGSTSPAHRGMCEAIQFPGGLVIAPTGAGPGATNHSLLVSYGTNDCEAKLAVMSLENDVLPMLR